MSMELLQRIKRIEEKLAELEEKLNNYPIQTSRDAEERQDNGTKRPYKRRNPQPD